MLTTENVTLACTCAFTTTIRGTYLECYSYVGRLTPEEMSLLSDMTKNMVKPRSVLGTFKYNNPKSHTTIR